MKQFVTVDCEQFMINAEEHFDVTQQYYEFFQQFYY